MNQSYLDRVVSYAMALAGDVSVSQLPTPVQTVVVITTVQGIIDNGGLTYFYENDFPGNPPYSFFVEAFRRIYAESIASCIEESAVMFPFPQPHLFEAQRRQWRAAVKDDEAQRFKRLDLLAVGDTTVSSKLADYVEMNRGAFDID